MIIKAFCAVAVIVSFASAGCAQAAAPCDTEQHHQFDFWIGKWKVFPNVKGASQVATSLIESLYAGCGIRENWMPASGTGGGSMNTFSNVTNQWEQFWVDSGGSAVHFTGGWNGTAMVIQGLWPQAGHPNALSRITYTPLSRGRVEQLGEFSYDDGQHWSKAFDFIYRPVKRSADRDRPR